LREYHFCRSDDRRLCYRWLWGGQSRLVSHGAEFDDNQLHDDLQFAGGKLSNDVRGAANLAGQLGSRHRHAASEQHYHRQSVVSEHLLVTTTFVPNQLCADLAVAVMDGLKRLRFLSE
jgi:hypothetical protein